MGNHRLLISDIQVMINYFKGKRILNSLKLINTLVGNWCVLWLH